MSRNFGNFWEPVSLTDKVQIAMVYIFVKFPVDLLIIFNIQD